MNRRLHQGCATVLALSLFESAAMAQQCYSSPIQGAQGEVSITMSTSPAGPSYCTPPSFYKMGWTATATGSSTSINYYDINNGWQTTFNYVFDTYAGQDGLCMFGYPTVYDQGVANCPTGELGQCKQAYVVGWGEVVFDIPWPGAMHVFAKTESRPFRGNATGYHCTDWDPFSQGDPCWWSYCSGRCSSRYGYGYADWACSTTQ